MPKSTPMSPGLKTPSAACPGGKLTAPCPCTDAAILSQTVATVPSDRARKKLGVGEPVRLKYSLGSANWSLAGKGKLSSNSGELVTYTAPDRAESVTITATGAGCSATITFEVIEPSGVRLERATRTKGNHQQGRTSVGFIADIYILPADVSFEYCSYSEDEVFADGTGCYERSLKIRKVGHAPNPNPVPIGPPVNDTSGSKTKSYDRVSVAGRACDGTMTHAIPVRFQVGSGESKIFKKVDQVTTTTKDGGADISKGGASNHSNLTDPDEKDDLFQ